MIQTWTNYFSSERGKGAYLNGKKIPPSKVGQIGGSLIATGFPSDIETARPKVLRGIQHLGTK